jgi:hypothetical protein
VPIRLTFAEPWLPRLSDRTEPRTHGSERRKRSLAHKMRLVFSFSQTCSMSAAWHQLDWNEIVHGPVSLRIIEREFDFQPTKTRATEGSVTQSSASE